MAKGILRVLEVEALKPLLKKEEQLKPDGKSAIDDFRIKQSKSCATGILKEYCGKLSLKFLIYTTQQKFRQT